MTLDSTAIAPPDLTRADGRPALTAWELDPDILHLNHGSYGGVTRAALARQRDLRAEMEADPVGWFIALSARVAAARRAIAPHLGVGADRFALVTNASAGASAVFGSQPHRPGGEIVVTDHGYGAVTMGAERLARRWGGSVRTAHVPLAASAEEAAERVLAECGSRTALVVVDQITSPTARRLPVETIARAAAERGIPTLIDGAHAPGMSAHPVPAVDAYWVGNLHKFGCAPRGVAALTAPEALRDGLYPVIDSWGARAGFPERFDEQGTVDATAILSAETSFRDLESEWGWGRIRAHAEDIATFGADVIADAFGAATGEDHRVDVGMPVGQIRLIRLPGELSATPQSAHRLRDRLKQEYAVASAPTSFGGVGYLRISTHAYSTAAHYERFVESVVPDLIGWARAGTM